MRSIDLPVFAASGLGLPAGYGLGLTSAAADRPGDGATRITGSFGAVPRCGDGLVVGDEVCDDGNRIPGDGCSDTCRVPEPAGAAPFAAAAALAWLARRRPAKRAASR